MRRENDVDNGLYRIETLQRDKTKKGFPFKKFLGGRKTTGNIMDRCIGRHCKIVAREPSWKGTNVVIGVIKDIDHNDGLITVESWQGLGLLSIESIVAIKPKKKHRG